MVFQIVLEKKTSNNKSGQLANNITKIKKKKKCMSSNHTKKKKKADELKFKCKEHNHEIVEENGSKCFYNPGVLKTFINMILWPEILKENIKNIGLTNWEFKTQTTQHFVLSLARNKKEMILVWEKFRIIWQTIKSKNVNTTSSKICTSGVYLKNISREGLKYIYILKSVHCRIKIANNWNQFKNSKRSWLNKFQIIPTVEKVCTTKRKEIGLFVETWLQVHSVLLHEKASV